MGYNKEDYRRIRDEYRTKYLDAQQAAADRRYEVENCVAGISEIDEELNKFGASLVAAIAGGADSAKALEELQKHNTELLERRGDLLEAAGYPRDYTDIKYECELCGDTGYTDAGMCVCMKKKLILAGYESSGIGDLLNKQTFENFSLDYYKDSQMQYNLMKANYKHIREYAENFEAGKSGSIAMFGGTGLGKTHLSSAVAGVLINRGFDVFYTTALGMFSDFERERFGSTAYKSDGEQSTDRYYSCDLLIIDDIGVEVINQFTTSCLYDIINYRITKGRSTMISTNLRRDEFRQKYWDRITSRVFGEFAVYQFEGSDIRLKKLGQK